MSSKAAVPCRLIFVDEYANAHFDDAPAGERQEGCGRAMYFLSATDVPTYEVYPSKLHSALLIVSGPLP